MSENIQASQAPKVQSSISLTLWECVYLWLGVHIYSCMCARRKHQTQVLQKKYNHEDLKYASI